MATRFYMPTVPAAPIAPTYDTNWETIISGAFRWAAVRTKSNAALSDISAQFPSTATQQRGFAQWVSEALDVNQTIAGTVSMVVRCQEGDLANDAHLAFSLRVIGPDLTVRGTLKLQHATATEFTTAAQTRIHSALALTSVNALAGDYLVMEVGIHGVTPATVTQNILRFGDPTAVADFALTSGLTTDLCPWWEMSQTLTFSAPPATFPVEGGLGRRRRNILRRL